MAQTTAVFVPFPRHAPQGHVDLVLALAMLNKARRVRGGGFQENRRAAERSRVDRGQRDAAFEPRLTV